MTTEIIPYILYRDVPAALDWLGRAFGFREDLRVPKPNGMHAEMSLGDRRIMLGQCADARGRQPSREPGTESHGVFVYLVSVDAHLDRATAAGAEIVQAPADHGYGRTYTARDLDGHLWFFTEAPAS